jgi:hypothetical protein
MFLRLINEAAKGSNEGLNRDIHLVMRIFRSVISIQRMLEFRGARKLGMGASIANTCLRNFAPPSSRVASNNEGGVIMAGARSITIGKTADELRDCWLDPRTPPKIMACFATLRATGDVRMHW